MSILLPANFGVQTAKPSLLDFGAWQVPPMGGAAQRLNRIGNRFAMDVVAPTSSSVGFGRLLASRLMQGMTQGVIVPFPQDMHVGAPGAPVVDGAGQTGMTLKLRSGDPEYAFREGQFFNVLYNGRHYLHFVAAETIVGADGRAALPIYPMLRISPNDGDTIVMEPVIEGFMSGNALQYQIQTAPFLDVSFTVTEAA